MIVEVPNPHIMQSIYFGLKIEAEGTRDAEKQARGKSCHARIQGIALAHEKALNDYVEAMELDRMHWFMAGWH